METETVNRLLWLIETIPPLLYTIPENTFAHYPAEGQWSKKEILGHLIDSATNNHQRFIRTQFEDKPVIGYDQNNWVKFSRYNGLESKQLILFWQLYNRHLAAIIVRIMPEDLQKQCYMGNELVTLSFVIEDYVKHLEHHLRQLIDYD